MTELPIEIDESLIRGIREKAQTDLRTLLLSTEKTFRSNIILGAIQEQGIGVERGKMTNCKVFFLFQRTEVVSG